MGEPFMAHCFHRAFSYAVVPWTEQWQQKDDADSKLAVKCPITMQQADLSVHLYADDINKKALQHQPTEREN
eukprot:8837152-Pyramimonas_sp.AAC.1